MKKEKNTTTDLYLFTNHGQFSFSFDIL